MLVNAFRVIAPVAALAALAGVVTAVHAQDGQAADSEIISRIAGQGGVFDFTKLDASGEPLSDQDAIYTITPWICVRDNITGLMWEVKTTDGGLRDQGHTYTWYNPDPEENAGAPGTEDGGSCGGGIACDTRAYVEAVNQRGLCGYTDWRMPTRAELRSIVDYEASFPSIDTSVFPNTVATSFWTREPNETYPSFAWHTDFKFGLASYYFSKSGPKAIRLVRDGDGE
jgi:hypothetical protein